MFWSLAEPLLFMAVLYVVFGIGLRGGRNMDIPFITYLVTGMAITQFFSSQLVSGTNSIRSHSYLLKKINFNISVLPVVVVLTGIIEHLLFLAPAFVILGINGIYPNWYWFQILYYLFAVSILLLGVTWFTSAIGVVWPDFHHIASVMGRVIFYFSPVIWTIETLPENLQEIVVFNPLYYIVKGYRDSFFYSTPFWEQGWLNWYFWGWTLFMLITGTFIFRKIRPHFADLT